MAKPEKDAIRAYARGLGFDPVRFTAASITDKTRAEFADFLAQGLHGDMHWLRDKADRRADPQVLWPEARSVIVLGLNYAPESWPARDRATEAAISVYAQGRDY